MSDRGTIWYWGWSDQGWRYFFLNWLGRFWLRIGLNGQCPCIKTLPKVSSALMNYSCIIEFPQTNSLEQYYLILLLKVGNPGVIQLSVLAQGFMRLPSSEALTWAGGFPSKMAYSHSYWSQFPCWLLGESLSSFTWASLLGYLSVLKRLSWLLEWVIQEDEQRGSNCQHDLVSDGFIFTFTIF